MKFSHITVLILMFLSTMLGSSRFDLIQILIELIIFSYLVYKISIKGFKYSDIFILIIVSFSHLLSILYIPVLSTILNLKMALGLLLPIMFFNQYPIRYSKIFLYIFIINSIVIIFEFFKIYLYPFGILPPNTLIYIGSRPIGVFLNPHISSTYTALFTLYLILFEPHRRSLILFSIVVILLNGSWTALIAIIIWSLFYYLGQFKLLRFLGKPYLSIVLTISLIYLFILNFDFFIEILKQIPNSRWYSFELIGKVILNSDYYKSAIHFLPRDYYSVIKYQEDILLLAVGNESAFLKIIIENGFLCGLLLLIIAFKNMKHISIFFFITLMHYSSFLLSPFILGFGLLINKNYILKK